MEETHLNLLSDELVLAPAVIYRNDEDSDQILDNLWLQQGDAKLFMFKELRVI